MREFNNEYVVVTQIFLMNYYFIQFFFFNLAGRSYFHWKNKEIYPTTVYLVYPVTLTSKKFPRCKYFTYINLADGEITYIWT